MTIGVGTHERGDSTVNRCTGLESRENLRMPRIETLREAALLDGKTNKARWKDSFVDMCRDLTMAQADLLSWLRVKV